MMERSLKGTPGVRGIWRAILWGTLGLLLLLPALAMQVTTEVDWGPFDFLIMGMMLALLGCGIEGAMRLRSWRARLIAAGAALTVFLLVWAELAVGVFGTPFAGS